MMRVFVHEHLSAAAHGDDELRAAGTAMRDAVVQDLLRAGDCAVSVATGPAAPDAPAGAVPVQCLPGESMTAFVARQARHHDRTWVIAPETGGVLADLRRAVGGQGWLGCTLDAITLASSKRATLRRAAEHGLVTPLAFESAAPVGGWIVKPDDGAGALATRRHARPESARADADARRAQGLSVTLEPWVDGDALSLSLLCGPRRTELLSINRQRLSVDAAGWLSFTDVEIDALPRDDARAATLRAWAGALRDAFPGLGGFVGVDLVWHTGRGPVLIEVNPRVTMACVGLSGALGRNLAAAVLAAHEEAPLDATA